MKVLKVLGRVQIKQCLLSLPPISVLPVAPNTGLVWLHLLGSAGTRNPSRSSGGRCQFVCEVSFIPVLFPVLAQNWGVGVWDHRLVCGVCAMCPSMFLQEQLELPEVPSEPLPTKVAGTLSFWFCAMLGDLSLL